MKLAIVFVGVVALSVLAFGGDRDTIPLAGRGSSVPTEKSIIAKGGQGRVQPSAKAPGTTAKIDTDGAEDGLEEQDKPYVASLEAYGSQRINEVIIRETLGADLNLWLQRGIEGDPDSLKLETKLSEKIKQKFGFSSVDWSIVQYYEPGDLAIHITLDVVEKEEAAKRMPFLPEPKEKLNDPENLVKAWLEYEDLALDMVEAGTLEPEEDDCPAFHCPFGHKNPKLKKYEKIFVEGVKKHGPELMAILAKDASAEKRGAAAYLLAYLKDGKKVVELMMSRIKDPDAMVRNNVLRVLGDVAEFHPEILITVRPVLETLNFPRVSDRSKGVYLAYLLALNSQQARDEVLKSSVPALIQMMASKQPDHKELSHALLRKISGKDYPATDGLAWNNWFNRLAKERQITKK